jgi:tetratricopeptide (TPR) repeat protein
MKLARLKRRRKGKIDDIALTSPIELVVVSLNEKAASCRLLGGGDVVTLRAPGFWELVPGEIAKIMPQKQRRYAGKISLSGDILSTRLEVPLLDLVPLRLESRGIWNPADEYWGEDDEPLDDWAKQAIAWGKRPEFEMEQVIPLDGFHGPDYDPIVVSNDLKNAGQYEAAWRILMQLCESDVRCLDAHAHLGNLVFNHSDGTAYALRHYEAGLRIGELSLGGLGDGVLPWGWIDNRPFLRCMMGFGLCLWRLGRLEEAERVFDRVRWLNPTDAPGVRFNLAEVRARREWSAN